MKFSRSTILSEPDIPGNFNSSILSDQIQMLAQELKSATDFQQPNEPTIPRKHGAFTDLLVGVVRAD